MDSITKLFQFGRADIHVFYGFFCWMPSLDDNNWQWEHWLNLWKTIQLSWKTELWWLTAMTTKLLALKTMVQQVPACNKIRAKNVAEQILTHECNLNWWELDHKRHCPSCEQHQCTCSFQLNWSQDAQEVCTNKFFFHAQKQMMWNDAIDDEKTCAILTTTEISNVKDTIKDCKNSFRDITKWKTLFSSTSGSRNNNQLETRKKKESSFWEERPQIHWQSQSCRFQDEGRKNNLLLWEWRPQIHWQSQQCQFQD